MEIEQSKKEEQREEDLGPNLRRNMIYVNIFRKNMFDFIKYNLKHNDLNLINERIFFL